MAHLWIGTRRAPLRLPRLRTSVHVVSVNPILILQEKLTAEFQRFDLEWHVFTHAVKRVHAIITYSPKVCVL
jgi:hypothetical protein